MAGRSGVWAGTTVVLVIAAFVGGILVTPHLDRWNGAGAGLGTPRLEAGERLRGELTSGSPVNLKDGSRLERFRVDTDADSVLLVDLDAPFQGSLSVLDGDEALVARSAETYGMGTGAQVGFRTRAGGSYTLVVSGTDHRAFGPFSLIAQRVEVDADTPIAGSGRVRGWFDGAETTHVLEVGEAALYTIDLSSDAFDTVLEVEGERFSRRDDDGGDGTNSRVEALLQPGTYTLRVQAFGGGDSHGVYTLAVSSRPAPDRGQVVNEGPLSLGEAVVGWLEAGSPNRYTFQVESAGSYIIDVGSDDFDTVVALEGRGVSLEDDDGGAGTDSRLQADLPVGTYTVEVRAFGSMGSGEYTVSVRRAP